MIRKITTAAIAISSITLFAAQAFAVPMSEEAIMDEARSCAEAIGERVDLQDVNRVRHVVTDFDYAPIGHALRIRSEYFTDAGQSEFRAYCVVDGKRGPVQLRVHQIND